MLLRSVNSYTPPMTTVCPSSISTAVVTSRLARLGTEPKPVISV